MKCINCIELFWEENMKTSLQNLDICITQLLELMVDSLRYLLFFLTLFQ